MVGFGEDGEAQVDPVVPPSSPASATAVLPSVALPVAPRGPPPILAHHDVTFGREGPPSCPSSPNLFLPSSREVSLAPSIPSSRAVSPFLSPPEQPPTTIPSLLDRLFLPPSRDVSLVPSVPPSRAVSPFLSPPEQPPMPIPLEQPFTVARPPPSSGYPSLAPNTLIDVVGVSQLAAQVNPTNEGMDVDQDTQQVTAGIPTRGPKPGRGRNRGVRDKARVSDGRGAARDQTKRKGPAMQGEEQSSKRQRKGAPAEGTAASNSYPPTPIIPPLSSLSSLSTYLPDNAPTWVPIALKFLQSKVPSKVPGEDWTALGEKWSEAVLTWLSLEIRASFAASTKLGMSKRPSCISDWIQRARNPTHRPNHLDLHLFESDFLAWWTSLQPKWRRNGGELLRTGGNDWEPLRRTGVNGLLSVLAALFFWRYAIGKGETEAWEKSLDDVVWALQGLNQV